VRSVLVAWIGKTDLRAPTEVLGRLLGGGFNLRDLLNEAARHYRQRTMGNKTKATELVGLPSYQTLTNWLKNYEVQG
jgi:hypothetical protein